MGRDCAIRPIQAESDHVRGLVSMRTMWQPKATKPRFPGGTKRAHMDLQGRGGGAGHNPPHHVRQFPPISASGGQRVNLVPEDDKDP